MEALVTIIAVGAYSERQYQKQDGSSEYFKSRGVTMKRGGDNNDRHENAFYITDLQTL